VRGLGGPIARDNERESGIGTGIGTTWGIGVARGLHTKEDAVLASLSPELLRWIQC